MRWTAALLWCHQFRFQVSNHMERSPSTFPAHQLLELEPGVEDSKTVALALTNLITWGLLERTLPDLGKYRDAEVPRHLPFQ